MDEACLRALREIRDAWQHRRCVLIGASALDVRLGLRWRTTEDLDLAVDAGMDELSAKMERLSRWSRRGVQRWRDPTGVLVDMIPAGAELLAAGELIWPQTDARMNLSGINHALELSDELQLSEGLSFPVAPVAVLALLKMISYLDRPLERGKDLEDLAYLLAEYVGPEDPRRWTDDVFEADLSYEQVDAFVLGREMRRFVDERERQLIEAFIARVRDEEDAYSTQLRMAGRSYSPRKVAELIGRIRGLELGLGDPRRPLSRGSRDN